MKRLWIGLLLALVGGWAAEAAPDAPMCRNGDFPASVASPDLATVVGADKLYFQNDTDGCPNETAACRQRAYVVAGNVVLTGQSVGPYICVFFPNRVGGSAGYVRDDRLKPIGALAAPPLAMWAGHWANGDDTIDLKVKGAALVANGAAWWPSAHPSLKDAPGGPNEGELEGTATPVGPSVAFNAKDPEACKVTATLLADQAGDHFLVVADNSNGDGSCGGQNVSFTGVYLRKK
jgi:hypothetical protein